MSLSKQGLRKLPSLRPGLLNWKLKTKGYKTRKEISKGSWIAWRRMLKSLRKQNRIMTKKTWIKNNIWRSRFENWKKDLVLARNEKEILKWEVTYLQDNHRKLFPLTLDTKERRQTLAARPTISPEVQVSLRLDEIGCQLRAKMYAYVLPQLFTSISNYHSRQLYAVTWKILQRLKWRKWNQDRGGLNYGVSSSGTRCTRKRWNKSSKTGITNNGAFTARSSGCHAFKREPARLALVRMCSCIHHYVGKTQSPQVSPCTAISIYLYLFTSCSWVEFSENS